MDYLVKHVIKPFGIPRGSEKQGGQHQGSNSPVTWPVDFVTAMVIDGKVINLVNFWKHDDINAGDDLMLYVEDRPCNEYVLSHHPKCMKKQVFPMLSTWELPSCLADYGKEGHISNEGEDLVKLLWDLLSELSSKKRVGDADKLLQSRPPVPGEFDRRSTVNGDQLKSAWEAQEAMQAVSSGQYSRYNGPGQNGQPKPYITKENLVDLLPQEAFYEMKSMLFDSVDSTLITDFLMRVREFSTEYRVQVRCFADHDDWFYYTSTERAILQMTCMCNFSHAIFALTDRI